MFLDEYMGFVGFSTMSTSTATYFSILVIWTLVWKGLALWKAARNSDKWWYVAILVINTMGILEIIYYFYFSKRKKS